jgi:hypothetical protein
LTTSSVGETDSSRRVSIQVEVRLDDCSIISEIDGVHVDGDGDRSRGWVVPAAEAVIENNRVGRRLINVSKLNRR